jgi:hypothetical protein
MNAIEELAAGIAASDKIDDGTKAILAGLLQAAGPAVATLAPDVLQSVLRQIAGGQRSAAVETLAASLSQQQVVSLLDAATQELDAALETHAAKAAAARAIISALETAALSIVVRAILGAL